MKEIHQTVSSSNFRQGSVRFAPEVDIRAKKRAIRDDRNKVTKLLLQSDVAFVIDKSHSLNLLEQAKRIIDERFSDDVGFQRNYLNRKRCFDRCRQCIK